MGLAQLHADRLARFATRASEAHEMIFTPLSTWVRKAVMGNAFKMLVAIDVWTCRVGDLLIAAITLQINQRQECNALACCELDWRSRGWMTVELLQGGLHSTHQVVRTMEVDLREIHRCLYINLPMLKLDESSLGQDFVAGDTIDRMIRR